jgi:tetratricopeptide (TPR) repeat protein
MNGSSDASQGQTSAPQDANLEDSVAETQQASQTQSQSDGASKPGKTIGKKSEKSEPSASAASTSTDSAQTAKSDGAKTPDSIDASGSATARWKEVANNAAARLSDLFDEAKAKASDIGGDISKRVAGAADEGIDEAFAAIQAQAHELVAKGQGTRVRIMLRERELTEVPVAALAAAEAASLWWFGPVRMILGHMVGRAVLDFQFVSEADPHVSEGRGFIASGDLDDAAKSFDKALSADHTSAAAWFHKGVVLKMKGDKEGAKQALLRAEECDPRGDLGAQAKKLHAKL